MWKSCRTFTPTFLGSMFEHGSASSSKSVRRLSPITNWVKLRSDKSGPIVGNQAQSSDRRATIRSRSGLSLAADGNSYCSFLLKNDLPSCKTSGHGNLSEPSPMKILGESSDTEAIHAHFCPNFHPNYHDPLSENMVVNSANVRTNQTQ